MKKIAPFLILIIFSLTACATFPPPEIQDGRYINHKYAFSIDVPEGWYQTEKIPDLFKEVFNEQERAQAPIIFFNNDTNGCIFILSNKTIWGFSLSYNFYDKIYANLEKQLEKKKQKLLKDPYMKSFSYELFHSIEHWSEKGYYETEFNKSELRSEYFMYGCHKDDTCFVAIVLISDIKTFDKNYVVFNKVVNSLCKNKGELADDQKQYFDDFAESFIKCFKALE